MGGWAYPWGGDALKDKPAAKVMLHFAGGATEEIVLKNGVEFADYIGTFDVPADKRLVLAIEQNAKVDIIAVECKNNPAAG